MSSNLFHYTLIIILSDFVCHLLHYTRTVLVLRESDVCSVRQRLSARWSTHISSPSSDYRLPGQPTCFCDLSRKGRRERRPCRRGLAATELAVVRATIVEIGKIAVARGTIVTMFPSCSSLICMAFACCGVLRRCFLLCFALCSHFFSLPGSLTDVPHVPVTLFYMLLALIQRRRTITPCKESATRGSAGGWLDPVSYPQIVRKMTVNGSFSHELSILVSSARNTWTISVTCALLEHFKQI